MFLFHFVQRRKYYFLFSALVIIPGLISMAYQTVTTGTPVKLSIDFTGGSLMEIPFVNNVSEQQVRDALTGFGVTDYTVQRLNPKGVASGDAASRFDITLPAGVDLAKLNTFLQDPAQLGDFWSPNGSSSDPTHTAAEGVTTLDNGGTSLDVSFVNNVSVQQVQDALAAFGVTDATVTSLPVGPGSRWQIRMTELTPDRESQLKAYLQAPDRLGPIWTPNPNNPDSAVSSSHVSATVGREVTRAAFLATLAVAVILLGFIWFAFRQVPHAVRYGSCAIIAMFHDVFVTMGVMSILGFFFGWEVDALFLTAVLTVVGYSVQDTIVVFDRIRENIPKYRGDDFEMVVNRSVLETVHRSLATQLNAVFVMVAILLFGGETIRQFIAILLIGLMSGTYSSIFNAVPLLASWEKGDLPFVNREAKRRKREQVATTS
jgi:preprotein translocase subunit SecF